MPTIPNFPSTLADQHHHWHDPSAHPGAGPGRTHPAGTAGGGLEFLTFHRNFMAQVMSWYNTTSFTQAPFNDPAQKADLVAAWTSVPSQLQADSDWSFWSADAARLDSLTPDFASADELGTFIELGIHNQFLHGASASAFGEPVVGTLHSPQSTLFYKIHGLVDHWWSTWQIRHKRFLKELVKEIVKEIGEHKHLIDDVKRVPDIKERLPEIKERLPEIKDRISDVKLVALEAFDDPGLVPDPILRQSLTDRLTRLEQHVFPQAATFIHPDERPDVSGPIAEGPGKEHGEHDDR